MDEIVVRVARAIACLPRLRILSFLSRVDEATPTQLAKELRMSLDVVSAHLRRLSAVGLIQRRRSGVRCYCAARSPYSDKALSGKLTSWLRSLLASPAQTMKRHELGQPRHRSASALEAHLHKIVFEAATAFTNVRRVQLVRRLAVGDEATVPALMTELSMSDAAVSRHTAKLISRGYVAASAAGRGLAYRLASELKTPIHAQILQIVKDEWDRE